MTDAFAERLGERGTWAVPLLRLNMAHPALRLPTVSLEKSGSETRTT